MADYLTTAGINSLVESYKVSETTKYIDPLTTKKTTYQNLTSAWDDLSTRIAALKSTASDLQSALTSSVFNTKIATTSNSSFVTATVGTTASSSNYNIRVSQLAKSDLVVSNNMASSTAVTSMNGTHTLQIGSGDYHAVVNVALTGDETNATIMQKASDAINSNKAVITSSSIDGASSFTGSGAFKIDLNGTVTSINYDYSSGKNYADIVNELASKINSAISGVTAEKVVSDGNVSLKITANNTSNYISIKSADDTGGLLNSSNLNIDVNKLKGAAGLVSAANFTPASGYSKFSLTAKSSGYDNKLTLSDSSGSFFNFVGLNSSILSGHTLSNSDTAAGFIYSATDAINNQLSAKFVFNGINIQSDSNSVDTLATGVVFNLNATMAPTDNDVTVNVQTDVAGITNKIRTFVQKYNDVYTYMKGNYTSSKDGRGLFTGDSTVSALMRTMTNIGMSNIAGTPTGNLQNLSLIGITFDPDAGLTLTDQTKLTNALTNTPSQVANLFNSSNGVATRMYNESSRYVGSSGIITKLESSYNDNIRYITDKITSTQARVDKSVQVLQDQYTQLQMQMSAFYQSQLMYQTSTGG